LLVLQLYSLKTRLLQIVLIRLQGTAVADGVCLDVSDTAAMTRQWKIQDLSRICYEFLHPVIGLDQGTDMQMSKQALPASA